VGLTAPRTILAADWIFPVASPPVERGGILIENTVVRDLGPLDEVRTRNSDAAVTRLPPGALMPGLVNAHVHLELAALERLPAQAGFSDWLARLVDAKSRLEPGNVAAAAHRAAADLKAAGTAYAADVFNIHPAADALAEAGIAATLFQELIGPDPGLLDAVEPHPRARVLPACHTPYSSGPELLKRCARVAAEKGVPWSLHLAESKDETELLLSGKGKLADFLRARGVGEALIPKPGKRPIGYVDELGCLNERLIAVHLAQAGSAEIALLARRGVRPCLCPSSNLHLTGALPLVDEMIAAGLRPALGTDSTASGQSLNLFGEMEILLDRGVGAAIILKMATLHGAEALRLSDDYGRIVKGKRPPLIHVSFDELIEKSRRPEEVRRPEDAAASAIRNGANGRIAWISQPRQLPR
jgi:cytosine/adenosine deaminase-related metal-dependent hydrolase